MNLEQDEIVDRYRVEQLIGEGGMARVYRVRHVQLGSLHALKVLSMPVRSVRERLLQEGRVQASLRHEHAVHVHDIIEVDGAPGLVMEYIDGPSLSAFIRSTVSPLSWAQIDELAVGMISGVQHAHDVGVVHRDLKPGNVLLAIDDRRLVPKITDFGLAKVVATGSTSGSTRSGVAGESLTATPNGASASSIAVRITALLPMMGASPMPLLPVSENGLGVSRCPISISGASTAVGMRYSATEVLSRLPLAS